MYTKLKDVMRSKGYEVSEGGDWAASDTPLFTAFAKFVLGAQHISPNQVMAHPEAFPVLMENLRAMSGEDIDPPAPMAAEIDPPAAEAAAEPAPIDPPAEAAPEVEQAPVVEEPQEEQPSGEASDEQPVDDETPADEGQPQE